MDTNLVQWAAVIRKYCPAKFFTKLAPHMCDVGEVEVRRLHCFQKKKINALLLLH